MNVLRVLIGDRGGRRVPRLTSPRRRRSPSSPAALVAVPPAVGMARAIVPAYRPSAVHPGAARSTRCRRCTPPLCRWRRASGRNASRRFLVGTAARRPGVDVLLVVVDVRGGWRTRAGDGLDVRPLGSAGVRTRSSASSSSEEEGDMAPAARCDGAGTPTPLGKRRNRKPTRVSFGVALDDERGAPWPWRCRRSRRRRAGSPGEWTRRCGRDRGARPAARSPHRARRSRRRQPPGILPADAASPEGCLRAGPRAGGVDRRGHARVRPPPRPRSSCRAPLPDDTPVTVADLACQALVTQALRQSLGGNVVVSARKTRCASRTGDVGGGRRSGGTQGDGATAVEALARRVCVDDESLDALDMRRDAAESTRRRGGKSPVGSVPARPRYFVLDPIDGTKAFIRGVDDPASPQCAVGLARVDPANGAPDLGVLGLPFWRGPPLAPGDGVGVVVAASAGKGCWYKPLFSGEPGGSGWRRARTSTVADVSAATVVTSEGERLENLPIGAALASKTFGGASQTPREVRMGCGSLCKYAAVALDVRRCSSNTRLWITRSRGSGAWSGITPPV